MRLNRWVRFMAPEGAPASAGGAAMIPGATPPAGTTPPAAATPPAGTTPPAAGTGTTPWYPEAHKGLVEAKQWKDPGAALESYAALEKLVGADAASLVKLPKAGDAESEAAFYNKLGRPEKPEGYSPVDALKGDPVAATFDATFHKLGLTEAQRTGILTAFMATTEKVNGERATQLAAETTAQQQKRLDALRAEVGDKFPAMQEDARRAMSTAIPATYKDPATGRELNAEQIGAAIEGSIGKDLAIRIFGNLGQYHAEDSTVGGTKGASGIMSPDAARNRMDVLGKDQAFGARLKAGDASAVAEFQRLTQIIAQGIAA